MSTIKQYFKTKDPNEDTDIDDNESSDTDSNLEETYSKLPNNRRIEQKNITFKKLNRNLLYFF